MGHSLNRKYATLVVTPWIRWNVVKRALGNANGLRSNCRLPIRSSGEDVGRTSQDQTMILGDAVNANNNSGLPRALLLISARKRRSF